jgi:two-component system cell cycle sensor histidine kinase/response regulator CckA
VKTSKPLAVVVDDQESLRLMLRSFLRTNGFRVLTAPTGGHALRICRRIKRPINVMITDVRMPEMSGFDLAIEAGQLRPEMPILLMSGAFTESDVAIRNRLGPRAAFVRKPLSWTVLSSKLRSVLSPAYLASDSSR